MLFAKVRYTENMLRILITLTLFFFTQSCELLQKRDIDLTDGGEKETRNFKVLSYLFIDEIAISQASDPQRAIRNMLSSINASTLVTTHESSFQPWLAPQSGCLPVNTNDLLIQRIRFNLNMGTLVMNAEQFEQQHTFEPQDSDVGTIYGAWGWLPPATYSFEYSGKPSLAWKQTAVPSLDTGSDIAFWSNGAWKSSERPDIGSNEIYTIKVSENFKARFRAPANSTYALLLIRDASGNNITCYANLGTGLDGEITVPQATLAALELGHGANVELKFVNTRMDTAHSKIDEIYIQSTSKHLFGQISIGNDQTLDFGYVDIAE